jgi:hypothetical protein
MRPLTLTITTLTLAGCAPPSNLLQSASLAAPTVVYLSADTIGVKYTDDGTMRVSNQQEAVATVARYCEGRYRIVGDSGGRIDAVCVR